MAPNGGTSKQISIIKEAAIDWEGKIQLDNRSPREVWTDLHTNISAKLKYPVPACTLSVQNCKSIMRPAISAVLPRSSISRTIASEIRDAPMVGGGIGVLSLFRYEDTSRTALLLDQVNRNPSCGKVFITCIEDMILESGMYRPRWKMDIEVFQNGFHIIH